MNKEHYERLVKLRDELACMTKIASRASNEARAAVEYADDPTSAEILYLSAALMERASDVLDGVLSDSGSEYDE